MSRDTRRAPAPPAARDAHRGRVYAAESLVCRLFDRADDTGQRAVEVYGSTIVLPIERRFASVESVQRYADRVLAQSWVRDAWPRAGVPVVVRARAGQAAAHYERAGATIALPPHHRNQAWAMREFVVLHELAHHLAPVDGLAAHGPEFADRYAQLVTEVIGPEAGLLLRSALHDAGVPTSLAAQ